MVSISKTDSTKQLLRWPAVFLQMLISVGLGSNSIAAPALTVDRGSQKNCPGFFARLKENYFIYSNYRMNRDGIVAHSFAEYENAWIRVTQFDLADNKQFLQSAIENKNPQIKFLEDVGFEFDFEKGHRIPPMSAIAQKYNQQVDELIQSGKIKDSDTLRPARMFQTKTKPPKIIAVAVGQEPPLGTIPVNDSMKGETLFRFIADGNWPIGEIMHAQDTNVSFAFHDLGHLGSFQRHPEFMASVREFARQRVKDGRYKIEDNLVNLVFESLSLGRKEARPAFEMNLKNLGAVRGEKPGPWTASKFEKLIGTLSDEKISQQIDLAHSTRHEMVDDFGGGRSDAITAERTRAKVKIPHQALSENPKAMIERAFDSKNPSERRELLAKYFAAMDHTMRISASDWLTEITRADKLSIDSPVYRYLCAAGIYPSTSRFYQNFCRVSGR